MLISQDNYLINLNNSYLDASIFSTVGGRNDQQDSAGYKISDDSAVFVVCDGMGGHKGGKHASSTAVNMFVDLLENITSSDDVSSVLRAVLRAIDNEISSITDADGNYINSGTTIVAVYINKNELYWVSAGDSRLYISRGNEFVQVTNDHIYDVALNENVDAGLISKAFYDDQQENSETLISFLGVGGLTLIDSNGSPFMLRTGDKLLLMTDGLYKNIPNSDISELVRNFNNPSEALRALERKVDAITNRNSVPRDNMTVTLITIK